MRPRSTLFLVPLIALLLASACSDPTTPAFEPDRANLQTMAPPAPAPLVTATVGASELTFWPYTTAGLDGERSDPVNVAFAGQADPRTIRDALLSLDGARGGPLAAFDCTWTDAIGGIQATYAEPEGWTGSVVQLECGHYQTLRFHLRLFRAGDRTLGNAHVEVLIPGTTDHQVFSWEVAEQFVVYDLARGGFLGAPPSTTGTITDAPTWRSIPPVIYNGLPATVRALAGGPATDVTEPVGIANDGAATVLWLAGEIADAGGTTQTLEVPFAQFIPKPFCASPGELVRVDGAVFLTQEVTVSDGGVLVSQTVAEGDLVVRSFDPSTGVLGEAVPAEIRDHYRTQARDGESVVMSWRHQALVPEDGPTQQLKVRLRVGPAGASFVADESCG